jgi:hypothetical protein
LIFKKRKKLGGKEGVIQADIGEGNSMQRLV